MMGRRLLSLLPSLFLLLALLASEEPWSAAIVLFAVVLHEGGHISASLIIGAGTPHLGGEMGGLLLSPCRPLSPREEGIVAAAGPLANLLCAALCVALMHLFGSEVRIFTFFTVNLLTALCNLLPLKGSDGERLLSLMLVRLFGMRGKWLADALSFLLASFLYFSSLYLFYRGKTGLSLSVFSAATLLRMLFEGGEGSKSIRE